MAVGSITIVEMHSSAKQGGAAMLPHSAPLAKQSFTSGVASVESIVVAPGPSITPTRFFWRIVFPVDVWVSFGVAPTAAPGDDFLLPANSIGMFSAVTGEKVAIIDA